MFTMETDKSFVYCVLLDHMTQLQGVQIALTILANEALLCLGGGAGDLLMGCRSITGCGGGRG